MLEYFGYYVLFSICHNDYFNNLKLGSILIERYHFLLVVHNY